MLVFVLNPKNVQTMQYDKNEVVRKVENAGIPFFGLIFSLILLRINAINKNNFFYSL